RMLATQTTRKCTAAKTPRLRPRAHVHAVRQSSSDDARRRSHPTWSTCWSVDLHTVRRRGQLAGLLEENGHTLRREVPGDIRWHLACSKPRTTMPDVSCHRRKESHHA